MMKRILLLICGMAHAALAAQPGELLEAIRPPLHAPANIGDACLDAAGNIYLWGGFSSVEGVDSGGIVRLGADGRVARILAGNFVPPNEQLFFWINYPQGMGSPRRIIALADGRLMVSQPGEGGALIDSEGNIDRGFFTGMPTETRAYPQFEREGNYYFILVGPDSRRTLVKQSVTANSWQAETIPSESWPFEPAMAIPGPNQTIRVLAARVQFHYLLPQLSVEQSVFLAAPDGTIIENSQLALTENRHASLHEDRGDGYLLRYAEVNRTFFWPAPEVQSHRLEWRDSANALLRGIHLSSPINHPFVFSAEVDGSFLATARDGLLTRYAPDSEPDPAFTKQAGVRSLIALPDGRYLINGTQRILANGEPDPAWQTPRLEVPASITKLLRLKSGRVLVAGNFERSVEQALHGLQAYTASGEPWEPWQLDTALGPVRDMAEAPDGSIVVVTASPFTLPDGRQTDLIRLTSDGRLDESFLPPELPFPTINFPASETTAVQVQADGKILVSSWSYSVTVSTWVIHRLLPDRAPDPDFTPLSGYGGGSPAILRLPDGRYFAGANLLDPKGAKLLSLDPAGHQSSHIPLCLMPDGAVMFSLWNGSSQVLRRWKNGAWDPSFVGELTGVQGASPGPAGKLYVRGAGDVPLARLHRNGRVDVTFRPPVFANRSHRFPGPALTHSATGLVPASVGSNTGFGVIADAFSDPATGNLWLAGSFNLVGSSPRDGLAVLDGSNVAGFPAWAAAALHDFPNDRAPDADPDGDGVPNWLEYATGADPTRADAPRSSLQPSGTPHGYAIPRNPDAPEVLASIEVSEDLENWRNALASEIALDSAGLRLEFTLLPNATARFTRVKFRPANP